MDVAWFLKQRVGFIRQLYSDSTAPFVERMRLIEAKEPPFEPPYSEDGEPAFLTEWIEASDSVQVLGHACVSMLAGALHVYFETWERKAGIEIEPDVRTPFFRKKGWLRAYQVVFRQALGVRLEDSGADIALLEQLVLARNRAQHPGSLTRVTPTHTPKDLAKHPSPFFLTDRERELIADSEASGFDASSKWMMEPTLHVNPDKLEAVLVEVERFANWFDEACFDQLSGRLK
ncbi:hypothetical protein BLA39750_01291 [Burkholderia lata]|uniref:Uncharacterized protein n=1 Tax=Burkholderia lata (strain ATCC 17760 / DSM 23089 / LMG 22485 / NCIMB 9086 / R18194 / 383) TaxID=482957 RepID=A0A6P2VQT8_BURL3|nr:hypothetical protein [Burkholderia lata]VWC82279.1 hypothetical protein BLA39750_01291 [Burkholderia lata]